MIARIKVERDEGFWIATSEEVAGLVLAGRTIDEVLDKCRASVPELAKANNQRFDGFALIVKEMIDATA